MKYLIALALCLGGGCATNKVSEKEVKAYLGGIVDGIRIKEGEPPKHKEYYLGKENP